MLKRQLQALLDRSRFLRPYRFRVVAVKKGKCTLELPHRPVLDRPGGIINGPALMAAAFGITNIVQRATARADELSDDELRAVGQLIPAISPFGLLRAAEAAVHHDDERRGRCQPGRDVEPIGPIPSADVHRVHGRAFDETQRRGRTRRSTARHDEECAEHRGDSGGHCSTLGVPCRKGRRGETEFS